MNTIVPIILINKKRAFTDALAARIENTNIECTDAIKVLNSRNTETAFHYLDTPYINSDQGHYSGYKEDDLKKLLQWMSTECKGKFLLSNYNSDILDEFIRVHGWQKKEILQRLKAPQKKNRTAVEVLVYNYPDPVKIKTLFDAHTGTKTD